MTEDLDIFNKLIKDQFTYGGQKYAHTETKESTDVLFDKHTYCWLVGTIDKYTHRFRNLERERDLLKISCYMYIMWLKRGFHLTQTGSEKVINTTVDVKSKFFTDFIITTGKHYKENKQEFSTDVEGNLRKVSSLLVGFSNADWYSISEENLAEIYCLVFSVWYLKYFVTGKAGEDTDTNNEQKAVQQKIEKFLKVYLDQRNNGVTNPHAEFQLYSFDDDEVTFFSEHLSEELTSKKGTTSGSRN